MSTKTTIVVMMNSHDVDDQADNESDKIINAEDRHGSAFI